jgi:hypothetical protein
LLQGHHGFEIDGLVPGFPVRIGTIDPKVDANQSVKVGILARARCSSGTMVPFGPTCVGNLLGSDRVHLLREPNGDGALRAGYVDDVLVGTGVADSGTINR